MPWQLSRAGPPQPCTRPRNHCLFIFSFPQDTREDKDTSALSLGRCFLLCPTLLPRQQAPSASPVPHSVPTAPAAPLGVPAHSPRLYWGCHSWELPICTDLQLCWEQDREPWNNSCAVDVPPTPGDRGALPPPWPSDTHHLKENKIKNDHLKKHSGSSCQLSEQTHKEGRTEPTPS